ncbi:hypothetical protein ABGB16_16855 [Micromonospora sp. B11E3]|uniref:hypothetical protein n=1 Tax=Micromonospora sp. B11E3 TaxID=3153562 RepID=UPI00325EFFDD
MTTSPAPRTDFTAGLIWRDANVRTGPSLTSEIVEVLLPDGVTRHRADGWTVGETVVEGSIVSDVWLRLGPGRWCSAVNFDQEIVAALPREARI